MTVVARPSALHCYLYSILVGSSILSGRQFLALYISAPAATGLAGLDLAAGSGFDEGLAITQFLQQTSVLYFFLEFPHGPIYLAILYYH